MASKWSISNITFNINGKTNGFWQEFYENGTLKEENKVVDNKFYPINFGDANGNQLLKDGTGKRIEEFGADGEDVYEQYYENNVFIKEVKIKGYRYIRFIPKKEE